MSAPAVDLAASAVFVVCVAPGPAWVLYKLSLATGAMMSSTPISAQVPGSGDTGDRFNGGNLLFTAADHLQRAALTVANGQIYVCFGSTTDSRPWHGWVMAYSEADLSLGGVFCTTPNGWGGGIWEAAGGPAVDASGNLYLATGNGTYDGITNFGVSIVKLSPNLALIDWFTPSNYAALIAGDLDLSSGRPMILNGLVVFGFKDFNVYSINSACMGHTGGTAGGCSAPQVFATNPSGTITDESGIYGGIFLGGRGYFPNVAGKIYSFALNGSAWNTTTVQSVNSYAFPGAQLTGAGQLVWAVTVPTNSSQTPATGTLRAFNAANLTELWNSDGRSTDALGSISKFSVPTIANGRVYVATLDDAVQVYGLSSSAAVRGQAVIRGQSVIR